MLEVSAVISVAAVGALWKIAVEYGTMREGMRSILGELRGMRNELTKDIKVVQDEVTDHEVRIREIERIINKV